ncbi:MAG: HlyC/CorC family transporter [Lachnospiraceae bacterium]|nr:HlyC/CorC family transporter [Lachnospiraceae bacterium]
MDAEIWLKLIILIILLLLSAFFSSAETAFSAVSSVYFKTLADEGDRRAERVLSILSDPGKMLSTILIGNNLVNISVTALATSLTIQLFGSVVVGISTGILTVLILIFGEIIPKTAARLYSRQLALAYSLWIKLLMTILTPVIFVIDGLSKLLLTLAGLDPSKRPSVMTERELVSYLDESHEEGVIETDEKEMIMNVFDLNDSLAKDIMIPRIDMTMIDVNASYRQLLSLFQESMYSRIPVYEDDKQNVVGIVMLKDFFLIQNPSSFSIKSILREPYYTYETKKTDELLHEMQEGSNSLAIVLDEYGKAAGLITLEDLLEEIVGQIRDEYDESEKELIQALDERSYRIEGAVKLDDVNDALDTELDSDHYDSIGGLMIEHFDRLPKKGESFTLENGISLTAGDIVKNRIRFVDLTMPEGTGDEDKNSAGTAGASDHESSISSQDGQHIQEDQQASL